MVFEKIEFPERFIEEWVRFNSLEYIRDYKVGKGLIGLSYFIPQIKTGIIVVKWKRPLTVSIIHKALRVYNWIGLETLIIVTNSISQTAKENLTRFSENINIVLMSNLSDLAVYLSSASAGLKEREIVHI